jgi:predicted nucleotidyltransferase
MIVVLHFSEVLQKKRRFISNTSIYYLMPLKNIHKIIPAKHKDLELFVSLCKEIFGKNLISIILFGSVARGKSTAQSDFDLCVVVKIADEAARFKLSSKFPRNCDILQRTRGDFIRNLKNLSAIDLEIFNEGIVIYGDDVLEENQSKFEQVKQQYGLINQPDFGKGVWEIGIAS